MSDCHDPGVSCKLKQPTPFFAWMAWTFLKGTIWLFYEMFLDLGWQDVSAGAGSDPAFFAGMRQSHTETDTELGHR